jgi:hypothetical protein
MARIPGVRAWITERRWIVALLAGGLVVRLALAALLVEAARLARDGPPGAPVGRGYTRRATRM